MRRNKSIDKVRLAGEIRIIVRRDKSMDEARLHRRDPDHCGEGQVKGQGKAAQEGSGSF